VRRTKDLESLGEGIVFRVIGAAFVEKHPRTKLP
jgi:hypothetical protein